jgi:hypothetical protein
VVSIDIVCPEMVVNIDWDDLRGAAVTLVQTEFMHVRGTLLNLCPNRRPL